MPLGFSKAAGSLPRVDLLDLPKGRRHGPPAGWFKTSAQGTGVKPELVCQLSEVGIAGMPRVVGTIAWKNPT